MMNQELKAKWVAALQSGKFVQGFTRLHWRNEDTYCCLGVLCVVSEYNQPIYDRGWLPPELMRKASISREEMEQLGLMNDRDRLSFKAIAAYIEEKL